MPSTSFIAAQVAAFLAICLAIVAAELALAHRGSPGAAPRARLTDQVMVLGTTAALLAGIVSAAFGLALIEPGWPRLISGVVLGLAGVALRAFAMATLGRYYALTPQVEAGQTVVTTGPYQLVRHPGYAGIVLSLFGLQLITGTWVALLAIFFVILPLPVRIRIEEQLLLEQLGQRYEEYERKTPYRLIPGIY